MKFWKWSLLILTLSACASIGNVKTDFDDKADFHKYKTYAFVESKELNGTGVLSNSIIRQRVETLLRENLEARGLQQVTIDQNPDLAVQYWVGVQDKQEVANLATGPSFYGSYHYGHWGTTYDRYVTLDYKEGTLIVDLIDRLSKDLVWRAYLVQTLEDDKDKNLENARKSLKKAFENYPPNRKSY